jgi:hypothetical protein
MKAVRKRAGLESNTAVLGVIEAHIGVWRALDDRGCDAAAARRDSQLHRLSMEDRRLVEAFGSSLVRLGAR